MLTSSKSRLNGGIHTLQIDSLSKGSLTEETVLRSSVSLMTIAGSGPSTEGFEHVDVATKKCSVASDYVFCRFLFSYHRYSDHSLPVMLYYKRTDPSCEKCVQVPKWYANERFWNLYYQKFSKAKPSTGLCTVFGVMERWSPKTIGLIGFDWVLDGYTDWDHDSNAEKECMLSLTEIKDLRNGEIISPSIRRLRP